MNDTLEKHNRWRRWGHDIVSHSSVCQCSVSESEIEASEEAERKKGGEGVRRRMKVEHRGSREGELLTVSNQGSG